jgi:hypothetical protein
LTFQAKMLAKPRLANTLLACVLAFDVARIFKQTFLARVSRPATGSVDGGEFLDQLSTCQLLKKASVNLTAGYYSALSHRPRHSVSGILGLFKDNLPPA